jgi:hypothetical protein
MIEPTAEQWTDIVEFVRGLPASEVELFRFWPLGATVRTRPGVILLVPAPGVDGRVYGYARDGLVVIAPVTIPHPEHGWGRTRPGEMATAHVAPQQLELVDRGVLDDELVERAIAEATA